MHDRPRLAGVAGALAIAFSAILFRKADVAPATGAVFRCLLALPALGVLAWREDRRFGPRGLADRRLAAVAGVLFAVDLIFWHAAVDAVGAGLGTVLGNVQVVLVPLAAWAVLSERPAVRGLVALPVVLAGVVLISGVLGDDAYGDDPALGVVYGLITSVAYTGFILVLRHGNRDVRRPAGPLFDATLVSAVGAALGGAVAGDLDWSPPLAALGWLLLLALSSQVVGWLLISVSLPRLPAATTSLLLTLQPVGSVVFSVLLLDEDPSSAQLAGVALVVVAIVVATVSRRSSEPLPAPSA